MTALKIVSLAAILSATGIGNVLAACPSRIAVMHGDTAASIAGACGINVEALRAANPGLVGDRLAAGITLVVPESPLPSPMERVGRPSIPIMPSVVPPAVGGYGTVILPPQQPSLPRPHMPQDFGKPGELPLPPGHLKPFP